MEPSVCAKGSIHFYTCVDFLQNINLCKVKRFQLILNLPRFGRMAIGALCIRMSFWTGMAGFAIRQASVIKVYITPR
jgi:hypothetical protein